jgi:6-phosphogluconolactonase
MKLYHRNLWMVCLCGLLQLNAIGQNANLLVGTYTQKGSKGIYLIHFDTATGKALEISHTDSTNNPSYLTLSKDKLNVYAVNETATGSVNVYTLNNDQLSLQQNKTSKGADPCYITLSPDQHNLFVANYTGGSITSFHRFADGQLSNPQQFIQHIGSSVDKERQEKAHVHGLFFSPDGKYLLTPDLGMDQIAIYPYQTKNSPPLDIQKVKYINNKPGSGPRHLVFSSNGKFIYIIEELTGSVSVYKFLKGIASYVQTIAIHKANTNTLHGSADIHLSPDGLFLYASNRGTENNIVKIPVLPNGQLDEKHMNYYPTQGNAPRNFTISPDGNWLLVANQNTDNIVVFKRDKTTGDLISTGNTIKISMPVCLLFY